MHCTTILVFVVYISTAVGHDFDRCEADSLALCSKKFIQVWKGAKKGQDELDIFCGAFKTYGRCLSEDTRFCDGKVIDLLREGFREHMVFNMRTNVCPYDDSITNLNKLVKANIPKKSRKKLNFPDLENIPLDTCDIEVNDFCARKTSRNMLEHFKESACMAEEVEKRIIDCFESKQQECQGKLFLNFLHTLKKVGRYVMFSQTQHKGILSNCKKIRPPPSPPTS